MNENPYLQNEWIQHYLEEADKAIEKYQAAKARGDMDGVIAALKNLDTVPKWISARKRKVDKGRGNEPNTSGWNPPGREKLPPEPVRKDEVA